MKAFHVTFDTDGQAAAAHQQLVASIAAVKGSSNVAPSFGHGPAYIVAILPDDADAKAIFGEREFKEITTQATEAPAIQAEAIEATQPVVEPAQAPEAPVAAPEAAQPEAEPEGEQHAEPAQEFGNSGGESASQESQSEGASGEAPTSERSAG